MSAGLSTQKSECLGLTERGRRPGLRFRFMSLCSSRYKRAWMGNYHIWRYYTSHESSFFKYIGFEYITYRQSRYIYSYLIQYLLPFSSLKSLHKFLVFEQLPIVYVNGWHTRVGCNILKRMETPDIGRCRLLGSRDRPIPSCVTWEKTDFWHPTCERLFAKWPETFKTLHHRERYDYISFD